MVDGGLMLLAGHHPCQGLNFSFPHEMIVPRENENIIGKSKFSMKNHLAGDRTKNGSPDHFPMIEKRQLQHLTGSP